MNLGFIYFIQESETERIKIGFSEKHPQGRLESFQTGNSNKLVLLGYIEGTQADETRLHREFKKERIRIRNEWFEPSPQLKKKITDLLKDNIKEKENDIPNFKIDLDKDNIIHESISLYYDWRTFEWSTEQSFKVENGIFPDTKNEPKPEGRYTGKLKNGKSDGDGKLVYSNSKKEGAPLYSFIYEGKFKNGKLCEGKKLYTTNKVQFSGRFQDGKIYGEEIKYFDGLTYKGEWKNNNLFNGIIIDINQKLLMTIKNGLVDEPSNFEDLDKKNSFSGESLFYKVLRDSKDSEKKFFKLLLISLVIILLIFFLF